MNQKIESIGDALQLRALKTCAALGQVADRADDHCQGITREHRAAQHDGLPSVFASLRHWDLSPESQVPDEKINTTTLRMAHHCRCSALAGHVFPIAHLGRNSEDRMSLFLRRRLALDAIARVTRIGRAEPQARRASHERSYRSFCGF